MPHRHHLARYLENRRHRHHTDRPLQRVEIVSIDEPTTPPGAARTATANLLHEAP